MSSQSGLSLRKLPSNPLIDYQISDQFSSVTQQYVVSLVLMMKHGTVLVPRNLRRSSLLTVLHSKRQFGTIVLWSNLCKRELLIFIPLTLLWLLSCAQLSLITLGILKSRNLVAKFSLIKDRMTILKITSWTIKQLVRLLSSINQTMIKQSMVSRLWWERLKEFLRPSYITL